MLLITTTTTSTSSLMLHQQQLLLPNNCNKKSSSSSSSPPSRCCCCCCFCGSNSNKRNTRLAALIIPNSSSSDSGRKHRSWWQKFFFDEDCNWLGFNDHATEQLQEEEEKVDRDSERVMSEDDKFEAWKRRAEAITELREAQDDLINEESRSWEDWLIPSPDNPQSQSDWDSDTPLINNNTNDAYPFPPFPFPQDQDGSLVRSLRNLVLGNDDDDDLLYEDRVFRYASTNSAKFLAVLIIVPCALDFLVHDYLLMPFLDRYVKTVPLAAQMLDVRRPQKLEIIEELKMEKARLRLEVEIGKSPPLSDDQAWWELRDKALELREEWRLHNRSAFANIWSDMVFGVSLFIVLYLNQTKVALLKFTGYKIINNISDTGKAFLIILITDIFLGYHSESGWQTLLEVLVEHYGFEVDQSVITIFICLVPVIIDACVKLWLFKFLPRLSPKVANLFREMKRH